MTFEEVFKGGSFEKIFTKTLPGRGGHDRFFGPDRNDRRLNLFSHLHKGSTEILYGVHGPGGLLRSDTLLHGRHGKK